VIKMSKILVIAEHQNGKIKKSTLTTLDFAQKLSEKNGASIDFAILGNDLGDAVNELQTYSGGSIYVADHADLTHALAPTWSKVIADITEQAEATVVACSASTLGKDIMPRVAARLEAGMASDVVGITDTDEGVAYRRPMWAGALLADVIVDTDIHVVTVRGSAFDAAGENAGSSEVVSFEADPQLATSRTRFVSFDGVVNDRPDLSEAEVVVSGGRGLKSAEGFQLIEPLADSLNAAIGASRAAVDDGYAPNDYQIGQTGKVVAPQLYFAIAISGAIQHLAGMKNSKVIVAINTRDDEPIFKVADYGLVADAFQVVLELAEKLNAL
jgi:electron transfer flavoprotein alpha subunit